MGEVFQEMVLPLWQTPVMVTLVPVQVLTAEDVIVGASNGLTLTTKALLVITQGVLVHVKV